MARRKSSVVESVWYVPAASASRWGRLSEGQLLADNDPRVHGAVPLTVPPLPQADRDGVVMYVPADCALLSTAEHLTAGTVLAVDDPLVVAHPAAFIRLPIPPLASLPRATWKDPH